MDCMVAIANPIPFQALDGQFHRQARIRLILGELMNEGMEDLVPKIQF
jgi:hypothetical protein